MFSIWAESCFVLYVKNCIFKLGRVLFCFACQKLYFQVGQSPVLIKCQTLCFLFGQCPVLFLSAKKIVFAT